MDDLVAHTITLDFLNKYVSRFAVSFNDQRNQPTGAGSGQYFIQPRRLYLKSFRLNVPTEQMGRHHSGTPQCPYPLTKHLPPHGTNFYLLHINTLLRSLMCGAGVAGMSENLAQMSWDRSAYPPQVAQLDEPQVAQELPVPATGVETPSAPLETQANLENTRREGFWHLGQSASSSALEEGRINSKMPCPAGHEYSYIGILPPTRKESRKFTSKLQVCQICTSGRHIVGRNLE
jgi:hypothetical protein